MDDPGRDTTPEAASGASLRRRTAIGFERFNDRFGLVLVLIVVSLLVLAVAGDRPWGQVAVLLVLATTLILTLRAAGLPYRLVRLILFIVLAATVGAVMATIGGSESAAAHVSRLVSGVFVVVAPAAIVYRITRQVEITGRTVMGALCIYLLIGQLYAYVYGTVGALSEAPFFAQPDTAERSINYLYFSFVTQTTVGYGDLTAASDLGRILAATEALFGQIYLVTVVAVIVGNIGRARRSVSEEMDFREVPNVAESAPQADPAEGES